MNTERTMIKWLMALALLGGGSLLSAQEDELDSAERAELRQQIQQARDEMAEAARRMARLQRQLGAGDRRIDILRLHGDASNEAGQAAPIWFGDNEDLALGKFPPRLGVLLSGPASDAANEIIGLTPGGGAEMAGIEQGDRLVSVNGKPVAEGAPESIRDALNGIEAGKSVPVVIERDGERLVFEVETSSIAGDVRVFGLRPMPEDGEFEREIVIMRPDSPLAGDAPRLLTPPFPPRAPLFSVLGHDSDLISNHAGLERYFGTADGVVVLRIDPDNDFGLRDGDVVLRLDDEAIRRPVDLGRLLLGHDPGDEVVFEIMREGVLTQIPATVPARTEPRDAFPMRIEFNTAPEPADAPAPPQPF